MSVVFEGDGAWSKYTAWRMAKKFVEKGLKFPAESTFLWYDRDFVEVVGDYRYKVNSYVDASNALGVKRRVAFVIILRKEGDEWILKSRDIMDVMV